MSALRRWNLIGTTLVVAVLGFTASCGDENTTSPPAAQPTQTPSASGTPNPGGTHSTDCPDTIASVRAAVEKAVWGKGAATSLFQPISVTICHYDADASGQDHASGTAKRTGSEATELLALVNNPKPAAKEPSICTMEIGPTFVLRFTDADGGVLSYAAEAFGCRRLVALSFAGQGKPDELAAPRQVTPELVESLGLR